MKSLHAEQHNQGERGCDRELQAEHLPAVRLDLRLESELDEQPFASGLRTASGA